MVDVGWWVVDSRSEQFDERLEIRRRRCFKLDLFAADGVGEP
jgi:hypothetical protein